MTGPMTPQARAAIADTFRSVLAARYPGCDIVVTDGSVESTDGRDLTAAGQIVGRLAPPENPSATGDYGAAAA